jgi:biopolymer transport protein ExbD
VRIDTDDREEIAMNLAPMIDVVFLLLIFFMVATTFIDHEKEMGVELPSASSGEEAALEHDEIVINLLRDGTIKLGGESVDQAGLEAALQRAARSNRETPITIRGARDVPYQRVVAVMDTCRTTGLVDIGLSTLDG